MFAVVLLMRVPAQGGCELIDSVLEDHDRVEFSDIRRICRTLESPVSRFGLTLTDWFDPPDES